MLTDRELARRARAQRDEAREDLERYRADLARALRLWAWIQRGGQVVVEATGRVLAGAVGALDARSVDGAVAVLADAGAVDVRAVGDDLDQRWVLEVTGTLARECGLAAPSARRRVPEHVREHARRMLDDGCSVADVARAIGRSQQWVSAMSRGLR